jgi:hypothetical protein
MTSRRLAPTLVLPLFFAAQVGASAVKTPLHPFSPYRMFSKNWPDGVVMDRVLYAAGEQRFRPWDLLRIPFFQANQLSYVTFLDPAPPAQREALCSRLLAAAPGAGELRVLAEEVRFSRDGAVMTEAVVKSAEVHVCRR